MRKTDHKTLAIWVIDCDGRVMPYFGEKCLEGHRPRKATETIQVSTHSIVAANYASYLTSPFLPISEELVFSLQYRDIFPQFRLDFIYEATMPFHLDY